MSRRQGTVPYPVSADSRPIRALAHNLERLADELTTIGRRTRATASTSRQSWIGQAADAFAAHLDDRATAVESFAVDVAAMARPLHTFAAAIDTTSAAYDQAVTAEMIARHQLPVSWPAVAAALAAESAASAGLQAAGLACAGSLVLLRVADAIADALGTTPEVFDSWRAAAGQLWDAVAEAWEEGDADAIVAALNTTVDIRHRDGTTTRTSVFGWAIDSSPALRDLVDTVETVVGIGALLAAPDLTARDRPDLVAAIRDAGLDTARPLTLAEQGRLMSLVEELRRAPGREIDQSVVVAYQHATAPNGSRVLNLTVPGIVPPGERSVFGSSGTRNAPNAAADQITGHGVEAVAVRDWILQQGIAAGDTVNLFAHSQGGIVSRNVANDLVTRGIHVNVVSYGSPDGQFRPGVGAYVVQNQRDPVPALRIGGDGAVTTTLHPGQHRIVIDHEVDGGVLAHHDAVAYGTALQDGGRGVPNSAGLEGLRGFVTGQQQLTFDPHGSGVVTFEGTRSPTTGAPLGAPEPYRVTVPQPVPAGRRP
jgi:uncharacterized protein YukE